MGKTEDRVLLSQGAEAVTTLYYSYNLEGVPGYFPGRKSGSKGAIYQKI